MSDKTVVDMLRNIKALTGSQECSAKFYIDYTESGCAVNMSVKFEFNGEEVFNLSQKTCSNLDDFDCRQQEMLCKTATMSIERFIEQKNLTQVR